MATEGVSRLRRHNHPRPFLLEQRNLFSSEEQRKIMVKAPPFRATRLKTGEPGRRFDHFFVKNSVLG